MAIDQKLNRNMAMPAVTKSQESQRKRQASTKSDNNSYTKMALPSFTKGKKYRPTASDHNPITTGDTAKNTKSLDIPDIHKKLAGLPKPSRWIQYLLVMFIPTPTPVNQ